MLLSFWQSQPVLYLQCFTLDHRCGSTMTQKKLVLSCKKNAMLVSHIVILFTPFWIAFFCVLPIQFLPLPGVGEKLVRMLMTMELEHCILSVVGLGDDQLIVYKYPLAFKINYFLEIPHSIMLHYAKVVLELARLRLQ